MSKQDVYERWLNDADAECRFYNEVAVYATAAMLRVPVDQRGVCLERIVAGLRKAAGLPPLAPDAPRSDLVPVRRLRAL